MTRDIERILISLKETAVIIGRTETAVRNMVVVGKLPYVRADKRIMFDLRDIEKWIEENKIEQKES